MSKKILSIVITIVIIVLIICFTLGCSKQNEEPAVIEATTESETADELFEEPVEEVDVNITEEESDPEIEPVVPPKIDMNKVKFWEAIIDGESNYDLYGKLLDYPMDEIDILLEFIEGEITRDEEISKFWELATRIGKDFFLAEMMIETNLKNNEVELNEEMEIIISLIDEWSEKTKDTYSYYAKYLETNQAEYDLKVDELKEETELIYNEYRELIKPYMKAYNDYYNIK